MAKSYARFAASPIGPGLTVQNGGLLLTTTAATGGAAQTARSDIGKSSGTHGVEFMVYGDDPLACRIGVVQPGSSLSVGVGNEASSVGWSIGAGQVYAGNALVASGLAAVAKGDIVGLRVLLDGGTPTIEFYRGDTLVHSRALPNAGATYHFAVSPHTPGGAGKLTVAVNAGQWQAISAAARAGWQAPASAVTALRLADLDWLTTSTDSPAHARYEGLIDASGFTTAAELGFWPWGGDAPTGAGAAQIAVTDADGVLDGLAQQDVAGVPVWIGSIDLDGAASRAGATAIARYVMDRVEVLSDVRKVIHLRDAHDDLDEAIARGVFLPNVPQLAWRAQPVVIGAVANVPVLPANSDGSVGWLSDAPLAEVSMVLDRGDAMEAGTFSLTPDKQQLTLSMPPIGPVVADASSIGAGMQPATLEQMLREVFRRIGKASWSAADAAAIDAATGYAGIGYYAGDARSVRQALAAILPSYGAWWWQDANGVLRFARVTDPATAGAIAFDITEADLARDLLAQPDDAPHLSRRMAYRPNARPLAASEFVTDLVDVPASRRAELSAPWRGQVYSARVLADRYAHAETAAPMVSVFWRQQDAQAEIDRVCALYAMPRQFFLVDVPHMDSVPAPGQIGRLAYPRYGLANGRQVLVRRVERNPVTGAVAMILWG